MLKFTSTEHSIHRKIQYKQKQKYSYLCVRHKGVWEAEVYILAF